MVDGRLSMEILVPRRLVSQQRATAVVCVPTFRRPAQLRQTLDSLVQQKSPYPFDCLIVENDDRKRAGAAVASEFLRRGAFGGLCVVESKRGNCSAINRAFEAGRSNFAAARYFLMIDDDEIATPEWLARMVDAAERTSADIVGGPVSPRFVATAVEDLAQHPAFRPAYCESGPVPMIYGTGNCLVRRSVFDRLQDPSFDLRFNFLGGGDTDFFTRCRLAGLAFYWEQAAVVLETIPPRRTETTWLAARSLRIGAINYMIDRKHAAPVAGGAKVALKTTAIFALSLIRTAVLLAFRTRLSIAIHPFLVACGRILAGFRLAPEPYRHPEHN